jgi:hypothetical protein
MLNDSGLEIDEEFLGYFLEESTEVISNLKTLVRSFEGVESSSNFEKFGQQVDRIMGAAYTLSLKCVGDLAKMGKELGYKSSQVLEIDKLLVVQSLLSQLVKALDSIIKNFHRGLQPNFYEFEPLLRRLQKASHDLGNLRTSVEA